jgi:hypothetical protein
LNGETRTIFSEPAASSSSSGLEEGRWYADRSLAALLIPAALAAWALWVIVSAQRRPQTESAG